MSARPPLAILVAVSALQPFALNVLAPATPGLASSLATDYATIQLTLTLYLVTVAASQIFVGPLSDRIGRRPCILGGIWLFVIGSAIGAIAEGIEALLLARVVQAAGGGTTFALSRAVVRDVASKNEAASLIGYITMAMVVSPMVAPLIGGFIDERFGWRAIFAATLVLGVGVGLAAALLLGETRRLRAETASAGLFAGFSALLRNRTFLGYVLALSFSTGGFFVLIAGAPYVVVAVMGRPPRDYALFFIINAVGYMAGNFVSGRYGRQIGSERLMRVGIYVSFAAMCLELALMGLLPWTPATLFLPLGINSFGNGLTIPGGTATALSVRPDLAGTAAGLVGATQLGVGAAGSIAIGVLVQRWPPALVVMMLAMVVVGWAALALARPVGADERGGVR